MYRSKNEAYSERQFSLARDLVMLKKQLFSLVELPCSLPLIKGSISQALCDELEEAAKPFVENVDCNLINTKRTGWKVFQQESFGRVFQKFTDRITATIISFGQLHPPLKMNPGDDFNVSCEYREAWVAWYSSDSFVQPHSHGAGCLFSSEYSLSTYLKVPDEYTELTFFDTVHGNPVYTKVEVKQGDFLIFPSSLSHYSNDCKEGRVILSGNFTVTVTKSET